MPSHGYPQSRAFPYDVYEAPSDHVPPGVASRLRTMPRSSARGPARPTCSGEGDPELRNPRMTPRSQSQAAKKRLDPGALPRAGANVTPRPWTSATPFGHATLEEPPAPQPAPVASRQRPTSAPVTRHDPKRHLSSRVPGLADPREVSNRGGAPRSASEAGTSNQRDYRSNRVPYRDSAACRNQKTRALFRNLHHAPRMTTESFGGAMLIC